MAVYNIDAEQLFTLYGRDGGSLNIGYDINGGVVFVPSSPIVPTGDLDANETIPLPNIYEDGRGFTCTGLAFDSMSKTFLVGDIGLQQPGGTIHSQIVRISKDFSTVLGTIPLTAITSNDVQGIAIRRSDNTIWFCVPSDNKIYHITSAGVLLDYLSVTRPTGISYDTRGGSLWVLTMDNKILHLATDGTTISSHNFAYSETLDQCFLDTRNGLLYITAGSNYQGRNNVYVFNTMDNTQSITCTVDSYSVEGIYLDESKMYILNDGYYHSAFVPVNQVNIYLLTT